MGIFLESRKTENTFGVYKGWLKIGLLAAGLCLTTEVQAAGFLSKTEQAVQMLSDSLTGEKNRQSPLYEVLGEGRYRIGRQTYELDQNGKLLEIKEYSEKEKSEDKDGAKKGTEENESGRTVVRKKRQLKTQKETTGLGVLKTVLEGSIFSYSGKWEIYVKDLKNDTELEIGDSPASSASLIKTFVMAAVYDQIEAGNLKESRELNHLLELMITVSDNEAYNELMRRLGGGDFITGCQRVNQYLEREGYENTEVHHTLHPSSSASLGDGGSNLTSVKDCGKLLERIYYGDCVSETASVKMLKWLCRQQTDWKIPAGIPKGIQIANKTGETDTCQHDIAIVYAPSTTYLLCVMSCELLSENEGISRIQQLSDQVYEYFLED